MNADMFAERWPLRWRVFLLSWVLVAVLLIDAGLRVSDSRITFSAPAHGATFLHLLIGGGSLFIGLLTAGLGRSFRRLATSFLFSLAAAALCLSGVLFVVGTGVLRSGRLWSVGEILEEALLSYWLTTLLSAALVIFVATSRRRWHLSSDYPSTGFAPEFLPVLLWALGSTREVHYYMFEVLGHPLSLALLSYSATVSAAALVIATLFSAIVRLLTPRSTRGALPALIAVATSMFTWSSVLGLAAQTSSLRSGAG